MKGRRQQLFHHCTLTILTEILNIYTGIESITFDRSFQSAAPIFPMFAVLDSIVEGMTNDDIVMDV